MALSYFFEYSDASSNKKTVTMQTASVLPLPGNISNPPFPLLPAINIPDDSEGATTPTLKDSLYYNYYTQNLGVKFNYSEHKQLLPNVAY